MEKSEKSMRRSSGLGSIMTQINVAFDLLKNIPLDSDNVTAVLVQNNIDPQKFDGMLNDPKDIATSLAEALVCSPCDVISEHQKNRVIATLIANSTFKQSAPAPLYGTA